MRPTRLFALIAGIALLLTTIAAAPIAAEASSLSQKLKAYIECTNRLSGRAYESRSRYLSWVGKSGPTGREKIVYGTYTIYDTAGCEKGVAIANDLEPRDGELESAGTDYVKSVVVLAPLLKEAEDYYQQQNYKDDKMAKGRAMHPVLVAAWTAFAEADDKLRASIDTLGDTVAAEALAAIEQSQGRNGRYHIEALMMKAKRLVRAESDSKAPDLAKITEALADYEAMVKATDQFATEHKDQKIGSSFVGQAKSFLTTAKALMRRIRDKVPYDAGQRMIMNSAGGAWMVEGSPARLIRDYNDLVADYNRGAWI